MKTLGLKDLVRGFQKKISRILSHNDENMPLRERRILCRLVRLMLFHHVDVPNVVFSVFPYFLTRVVAYILTSIRPMRRHVRGSVPGTVRAIVMIP